MAENITLRLVLSLAALILCQTITVDVRLHHHSNLDKKFYTAWWSSNKGSRSSNNSITTP